MSEAPQISREVPAIVDMEASGVGLRHLSDQDPLRRDGPQQIFTVIRPALSWTHWDPGAHSQRRWVRDSRMSPHESGERTVLCCTSIELHEACCLRSPCAGPAREERKTSHPS